MKLYNALFLLTILFIVTGALAFASGTDEGDGSQEVTIARFFGDAGDVGSDIDSAVGEAGIIQSIINKYDEEQSKVKVNVLNVGWAEYYDELKAGMAAGNSPDIFVMHVSRLLEFENAGALADLTDDLSSVGIDTNDWSPLVKNNMSINGKIYGIPMDVHAILWHVNIDLFKQAGLLDKNGVPLQPTSMKELLAQAKQFKKATGKKYLASDFSGDILGVNVVLSWMWQQGSNILDENGNVIVNTPEFKKAINAMLEIFDRGYADPTLNYTDSQQQFLNGDVGVLMNGTWVVDYYEDQAKDPTVPLKNYAVYSFPTLFDKPATWGDSHMWAIPSSLKATDKDKYNAALELGAWIYEHNYDWSRTGHLSVRNSVLASDKYNNLPQRENYRSTVNIINNVTPTIYSGAIHDILQRELFSIWLNGKNVDTALEDAQIAISDILLR